MNYKYVIIAVSVLFFLALGKNVSNVMQFSQINEKNLYNVSYKALTNGENGYVVKDLSYEHKNNQKTDLILSFNKRSKDLHSDDTFKYTIEKANYLFVKGNGALGSGCAKFYKRNDGVKIQTAKSLWLGRCGDMGSFSIEFRFKTLSLKDGAVFFTRKGYSSGKKVGFEISLKNERVVVKLNNLFEKSNGDTIDISLNRGQFIQKGKWYHFLLSYDSVAGYLVKKINGVEEESIYVTKSGSSEYGAIKARFPYRKIHGKTKCVNAYDVELGKKYVGYLDEFRITHSSFKELNRESNIAESNYRKVNKIGRVPLNNDGIVMSPVYSFPEFGSKVINFNWIEKIFPGTAVRVQFRTSDSLFYKNDSRVKWYRIENNQRGIFLSPDGKGGQLRGKYFQWRAYLTVSPDGKYSPYFCNPKITFQEDKAPEKPIFLEKIYVSDKTIILRWKKNVDSDLKGYKIYYGTQKGRYDGVISYVDNRRLDNRFAKKNYVVVKIDNKLIEENRAREVEGLFNYPFIKNNVLYYFAVSAYDSYKVDTQFNHESGLSKVVSARPVLSSEINR